MILECFFGFEDNNVVENLFIISQAHCDKHECKISSKILH